MRGRANILVACVFVVFVVAVAAPGVSHAVAAPGVSHAVAAPGISHAVAAPGISRGLEAGALAAESDSGNRIEMYRLYNPCTGEHLFTRNASERNKLPSYGWRPEGTGWVAPEKSGTPVYRLYNPYNGDHHYTTNANERTFLARIGWRDEGVGWYSADAHTVPVYRLFNPYEKIGTHHYTTDAAERDYLASIGWHSEGVGWYALSAGSASDWVGELKLARQTSQVITVEVRGTRANVRLHEKSGGTWRETVKTDDGWIGREGLGNASEGSARTPRGVLWPDRAFGVKANPGCPMGYLQVDWSHYWVDDVDSDWYNQLISTRDVSDFGHGEHLIQIVPAYNYCLNMGWNKKCVPGAGSAFFLHCHNGKGATSGCVTVPESTMRTILQRVRPGCAILIDTPAACMGY